MRSLLQLTFLLLFISKLYAQQFIEEVKINEYHAVTKSGYVSIVGNGGAAILYVAGFITYTNTAFAIPSPKYNSSFYLTRGNANDDFLIKKDLGLSSDKLLYSSPYLYFCSASVIYKSNLNTGLTEVLKESSGEFFYPIKAKDNIFYWKSVNDKGEIVKSLYKTNGSAVGTGLVKELPGNKSAVVSKMVAYNDNVYFLENDSMGCRLWRSNGNYAGTTVVADVYCNYNNCLHQTPVLMNGCIYFLVDYPNRETYLWKYDVSNNTKTRVRLVNNQEHRLDPGKPLTPANRYPVSRYGLVALGNSLYFKGNISGETGLWKSNGTNEGTILVKSMNGEFDEMIEINKKLYFVRSQYKNNSGYQYLNNGLPVNPATLRQIWISDGTLVGTKAVKDFTIYKTCDPNPRKLMYCNNQLFFLVNDSTSNFQVNDEWIGTLDNTLNAYKMFSGKDVRVLNYNREKNALFYTKGSIPIIKGSPPESINNVLWKGVICNTANIPANNYVITQNASSDYSFNKPGTCDSLIAMVIPAYKNTNNLNTTARVWIEKKQPAKFVKRHYEITPTIGYNNLSGGRVTLYFKQEEFNEFNAVQKSLLPSYLNPRSGKPNIRIAWYPGTSNDHTGLPASYVGSPTIIDPADDDIIWNNEMSCWEVSFRTTGFGGFFLQAQATP